MSTTKISVCKSGEAFAVTVTPSPGARVELGQFVFSQKTTFPIWIDDSASHERGHLFLIDAARAGIDVKWSAPALRQYRKDRKALGLDPGAVHQGGLVAFFLQRAQREAKCTPKK